MSDTIRISAYEKELLIEKCLEINKILIERELPPIKIPDLVHLILEKTIPYTYLDKNSDVRIKGVTAGFRGKVRVSQKRVR